MIGHADLRLGRAVVFLSAPFSLVMVEDEHDRDTQVMIIVGSGFMTYIPFYPEAAFRESTIFSKSA